MSYTILYVPRQYYQQIADFHIDSVHKSNLNFSWKTHIYGGGGGGGGHPPPPHV